MPRKACFIRWWSTIALLAISLLSGVAHAAQRELKEVRVAYPPSMASVTLMTGIKQKFFEEQGLTLTLLVIASDLALKSQVVGEIDYTLFGGGSGMVAAAQGLPIRVVHLPHKFADLAFGRATGIQNGRSAARTKGCGQQLFRSGTVPRALCLLLADWTPTKMW